MGAAPHSPTLANKLQVLTLTQPAVAEAIERLVDQFIAETVRPHDARRDVLFEFRRESERWRCELCEHQQAARIEARFYLNGAFLRSQAFEDRAHAVEWAENQRRLIETRRP